MTNKKSNRLSNKLNWFVWFPYPSSWLKAFFIMIFLNVIMFIVRMITTKGYLNAVIINNPPMFVFLVIFALLAPIPLITFTHHILHLFFSEYISAIQTPEMQNTRGMKIQIFSWWEGLYGWLVIAISIIIATALWTFLLPLFLSLEPATRYAWLITIFSITSLFSAALLYQFEYCFKRRLLFINLNINKSN